MPHVFVSYSHKDSDFVEHLLLSKLDDAAFDVWTDRERLRAGDDWREEIDAAIRSAFALILVMTPDSKASEYVTYEWACAWGAGIKIVPLMLKTVIPHPRLEAMQYLDFTGGQPWRDLSKCLREIEQNHQAGGVRVPSDAPVAVKNAAKELDNSDPNVRRTALDSLAANSHPAALEVLADAITHTYKDVRIYAALHFAKLTNYQDTRAVPGLLEALRDNDVFLNAAQALEKIGQPAVLGLIEALHDENGSVRRIVARALGIIGDVCAVPGLIERLSDDNSDVRSASSGALHKIGTPEALKALREKGM